MPSEEVQLIADALNQTIAQINTNMLAFSMLIIFAMVIGFLIWQRNGNKQIDALIAANAKNDNSSNQAITQLAVALTTGSQYQQAQAQNAQRQTELLAELPSKLAEFIRHPVSDLKSQMVALLSRMDEIDRMNAERLNNAEKEIRQAISEWQGSLDYKPVVTLLSEYRAQDLKERREISTKLDALISLHTPPTEPDDQPPAPAGKTNRQPLDLDAAKDDATVDTEDKVA